MKGYQIRVKRQDDIIYGYLMGCQECHWPPNDFPGVAVVDIKTTLGFSEKTVRDTMKRLLDEGRATKKKRNGPGITTYLYKPLDMPVGWLKGDV